MNKLSNSLHCLTYINVHCPKKAPFSTNTSSLNLGTKDPRISQQPGAAVIEFNPSVLDRWMRFSMLSADRSWDNIIDFRFVESHSDESYSIEDRQGTALRTKKFKSVLPLFSLLNGMSANALFTLLNSSSQRYCVAVVLSLIVHEFVDYPGQSDWSCRISMFGLQFHHNDGPVHPCSSVSSLQCQPEDGPVL